MRRRFVSYVAYIAVAAVLFTSVVLARDDGQKREPDSHLSNSETYSDTLQLIKAWADTNKHSDLARLLQAGNARANDLLTACHSSEEEIAGTALLTLLLLEKSEIESCARLLSQKVDGPGFVAPLNLDDSGFQRIDNWLASRRSANGYECPGDDSSTELHDSVAYALILDGSLRSRSLLEQLLTYEESCSGGETILGEVLRESPSLIEEAKKLGHDLRVDPKGFKRSIRNSAFFIPKDHREDSEVEVIYRNKAGNRVLLEVSYRCGMKCGKGYYVLLRKDGNNWRYALITMAWIS